MRPIRKISIGPDYKDAMHFEVGKYQLGGTRIVSSILQTGASKFEVWVQNPDDTIEVWKEFSGMPVSIEYKIEY